MANKQAWKNGEKTQFRGNSAVMAQKKAAEKQRSNGRLRRAADMIVTDEEANEVISAILEKAKCGDIQASTFLRDLLGEKPVEKVEQTVQEIAFKVEGVSPEEADELFG